MNYPLTTSASRAFLKIIIRLSLVLLLIFFVGFFIVEALSFIRLFEVTVVANPAINLIK